MRTRAACRPFHVPPIERRRVDGGLCPATRPGEPRTHGNPRNGRNRADSARVGHPGTLREAAQVLLRRGARQGLRQAGQGRVLCLDTGPRAGAGGRADPHAPRARLVLYLLSRKERRGHIGYALQGHFPRAAQPGGRSQLRRRQHARAVVLPGIEASGAERLHGYPVLASGGRGASPAVRRLGRNRVRLVWRGRYERGRVFRIPQLGGAREASRPVRSPEQRLRDQRAAKVPDRLQDSQHRRRFRPACLQPRWHRHLRGDLPVSARTDSEHPGRQGPGADRVQRRAPRQPLILGRSPQVPQRGRACRRSPA